MCYESEVKESHKGSNSYPSSAEFATATTARQKSVDGGEDQRLEAAGGEETIRRPRGQSRLSRGRGGFGEISKILPGGVIYPDPVGVQTEAKPS